MSDGMDKDQDPLDSNWLTHWENQCIDDWETENDTLSVSEERIALEKERAAQKLWLSFQNSASSISRLYKEGSNQNCVWVPFQNAASSVTSLYKDGMEVMKKCFELGKQYGQHRRNEEVISWTKRHRRHLRREEVVGYLCGKSPPPPHRHRSSASSLSRASSRLPGDRSSPRHQSPRLPSGAGADTPGVDMQPFCDALALQGLNGAMSNFGIRTGGGGASPASDSGAASNVDDIHGFILEEISRRHLDSRKRSSTATSDSAMDSPTRKRSRLL